MKSTLGAWCSRPSGSRTGGGSIIIGVNADAFSLKWRDFPREPVFVRRRTELALLPAVTN